VAPRVEPWMEVLKSAIGSELSLARDEP
jgi:hypothetical protein